MKATFESTLSKLVTAFFKGELKHGACSACAVGTICGGNLWARHFITLKNQHGVVTKWLVAKDDEIIVQDMSDRWFIEKIELVPTDVQDQWFEGMALIDKSGYTKLQLSEIEHAFEISDKGHNDEEFMFNGLMAVVDVLAEIHGISLEQKSAAKAMFVKENL